MPPSGTPNRYRPLPLCPDERLNVLPFRFCCRDALARATRSLSIFTYPNFARDPVCHISSRRSRPRTYRAIQTHPWPHTSHCVYSMHSGRLASSPDAFLTLEDLSNSRCHGNVPSHDMLSATHFSESHPPHWPFLNKTVHTVIQWLNNGQTAKSEAETTKLVHNVILSPTFNPADLTGFDAHHENQWLDKALSLSDLWSQFMESSVDILVPSGEVGVEPKTFTVPGFLHQNLTSVIWEAFQSPLAHLYHYSPFKLFWKSPISGRDEWVYGEIFTSDAFLDETNRVKCHAPVPPDDSTCKREKVVAAVMFSSDATMLTDFGTAKGWPIYFMLGNLSKYIRSQPHSGAMHHLAYIPSASWLFFSYFLSLSSSFSFQDLFVNSSHIFIQNGEPRRIQFFLIAAGRSCMWSGRKYLTRNSYMHIHMVS